MSLADTFSKRVAQAIGDAAESPHPRQRKKIADHHGRAPGLLDALASWLNSRMAARILLIDDDPVLAEMVKSYLGGAGFDVTVAPTGTKRSRPAQARRLSTPSSST